MAASIKHQLAGDGSAGAIASPSSSSREDVMTTRRKVLARGAVALAASLLGRL
jgi:hypothetical protein